MFRISSFLLLSAALPLMGADKPFAFGAVRFEENHGQTDAAVRYVARARGQQVFLTGTDVVFAPVQGPALRMRFAGAGTSKWMPVGPATDSISYYIGKDSSKWIKGAPVFDRVIWRNAYPGIDVAFYGEGERLEYDLMLAPGADPSRVHIQFDGRASPRVRADGTVEVAFAGNVIRQRVPDIWQETSGGKRRKIDGRFVADGTHGLRLALAAHERSKALVVDPVIEMATYFGGENDDEIVAITEGAVAGNTRSIAFPAGTTSPRPSRDIFVRTTGPINPTQTSPYAFFTTTIIGGSGDDQVAGIAPSVTGDPGFDVAGTTTSTDLPVIGSSRYNGGASDGFLAFVVLNQRTSVLASLDYIGGSGEDRITGCAGNGTMLALVGVTDSPDLPTADGSQRALAGGKDAFYAVLSPTRRAPLSYGYLGGSGEDAAYAVSLRGTGWFYIGGETSSADFPFSSGTLAGSSDAFLAEVIVSFASTNVITPPSIKATLYRIGGNGADSIRALVASPSTMTASVGSTGLGRTYTIDGVGFAGTTTSTDLGVVNAAQGQAGGDRDAFAGIWDRTVAAPRWMTYLGGSGPEEATSIAQNWAGDLYVGGWTGSKDLPVVNALQPAPGGGEDGMFAVFDYAGALQHLTYYGGSGDDRISGVGVIYSSVARVVGSTTSTDLLQRFPWQYRGDRMEGFAADIGSDYFIGPTNLILAKDGAITVSVRPARTAFHQVVTYQSSDPSLVRLVYHGRSSDQVSAPAEENISVEALADSGQADITVSAPGYTSKTIHVKLYPGAFVINVGFPSTPTISTWAGPSYVYASYYAIDPATGLAIGTSLAIRNGAAPAVLNWSVSDPSIVALLTTNGVAQIQGLKSGTAVLTLTVDGYAVLQGSQTITSVAPSLPPDTGEFHIGKDLASYYSLPFFLNGSYVSSGYRGTVTVRSGDPSRLLLSTSADLAGSDRVSVTMAGNPPAVYLQALADDGPVQMFVASSEFDGEIPMNVILEPAVVQWGVFQSTLGGNGFAPSIELTTGLAATSLGLSLQAVSGTYGSLRPGVAPLTLTISNSDPGVVELNRLTVTLGANTNYTVNPVAPGSASLTLRSSNPNIQPAPATLPVTVTNPAPNAVKIPDFPSSYYVGNGLQARVGFPYPSSQAGSGLTAVIDDPAVALISSSAGTRGSDHITIQLAPDRSDFFVFYLQGLNSTGATTLRIRFPGGEKAIPVILAPAGVGFTGTTTVSYVKGYSQEATAVAFALDRDTGIGISQQIPQPGPGIAIQFQADAPIQLNRASAVLTSDASQAVLDYTLPPPGQRASITVSTDPSTSVSPITSTLTLGSTSSDLLTLANLLLSQGELRPYSISGSGLSITTVTSGDPQNVLVSLSATDPGVPSISLTPEISSFFIHALGNSGVVTLKLDSSVTTSLVMQIGLQPLQLVIGGWSANVLPGGVVNPTATLSANLLRAGAGPFHFTVQSANPAVATVSPAAFDIAAGGTLSSRLTVTGVAPGITQLIIQGPPEIDINPTPTTVTVLSIPAVSASPAYRIGENLQGFTQIDLGTSFSNPNGSIVTLTSSDPGLLLLSRAASTPGTASVVVAVPAGDHRTQPVYLQGIAQGNVMLQVTANGATQVAATVAIQPSWVNCASLPISMSVGDTLKVGCYAAFDSGTSNLLQDVEPRAGFPDVTAKLASSDSGVFTVTPDTQILAKSTTGVSLHAVAAGAGVLQITPPVGFGPSPGGSGVPVAVAMPALRTSCAAEIVIGKDMQVICTVFNRPGSVTVTSSDPNLILASGDPKTVGAQSITVAPSTGQDLTITLQGLRSAGTAEVVISAPGYQDLRLAIALRPAGIRLRQDFYPSGKVSLGVGNTVNLTVSMIVGTLPGGPRAGANLVVDLTPDQAGILSVTPAHLSLAAPQVSGSVAVKAIAPGSTLLRMTVPEGALAIDPPIAFTVLP